MLSGVYDRLVTSENAPNILVAAVLTIAIFL